MFNMSKNLGLFALVCALAGLAGCGGGSGTDNKKVDLTVCTGTDVILADGSCGAAPPPPPCPEGEIRPSPEQACVKSDFIMPTMPATVADDEAVIYINKASATKDFSGYSLYTWQECSATWLNPSNPDANNADNWASETINPISSTPDTADPIYGGYFIVKLRPGGTCGSFIIRTPGKATQSANLKIQTATTGSPFDRRYFVIENASSGLVNARTSDVPICVNDVCKAYEKPALAISGLSAHWISPTTIVWDSNVTNAQLYVANDDAKITANLDGTVAGGTLVANLSASTMTADELAAVPQLSAFHAYSIDVDSEDVKSLLKKELVIVGELDGAKVGTRIQNYAVLDALYTPGDNDANEQPLGVTYSGNNVTVSVWAPTAQNVELRLFSSTRTPTVDGALGTYPSIATKQMAWDSNTGIWSYTGTKAELDRKYYRFRVKGYNYLTNSTNTLEVSDPSAVSLSADGYHSQIVNLNDSDIKPAGWDDQVVPTVDSFEAMSIYETHVRDFSILDASTPAAHRGKYLAFTDTDSAPVQHLKSLQEAGLTHIHLLPVNDGSSIRESAGKKYNLDTLAKDLCNGVPTASICVKGASFPNANKTIREILQSYSGDSEDARKLMASLKGVDSFNWNYDPQFYNAPEGSYSTDPDGVARILEMREMNLALHNLGLRVVYDVVYPHMAAAGIASANATFDKIVPGYYFRYDSTTGNIVNDTGAGADTATEHVMMGKFLSDSVVQWAEQYKVDGFRFDQSGYIPKSVLVNAYDAVKAVDPDNYFYAEAWTAGGSNASARVAELSAQVPLAGTGIGTFNDRIRDPLRNLAMVNGGELNAIRAGLTGNLAAFNLLSKSGKTISAATVRAYNVDPQEAINYVEKHDGLTLWDWMHLPNALPANTDVDSRVRIQDMILSVPVLSQGVPFIQMGSDLLRSKSMDHNSYNSGDWFNYVDFTKQTNNWMVGLPVEHSATDAQILAAFADPMSKPTPELIQKSSDVFKEFLAISKSKLFSLQTAEEVLDRVGFHDGGTTQVPNVIVMSIDDGVGTVAGTASTPRADLDPDVDAVVVVFNGTNAEITRKISTATGFTLHTIQQNSADATVQSAHFAEGTGADAGKGLFTVPAYTTAVFVKVQTGAQGAGLLSTITSGYEPPVPYGDTSIYVRGEVTTPNWSTANYTNELVYEGGGVYSVSLDLVPGTYQFKVASADWSTVDRGAASGAVTLGSPKTLAAGAGNLSVTIATAGNYRFELNALDAAAPILTVSNADVFSGTAIYVRGEITTPNWSTANSTNQLLHKGNSVYAVDMTLNPGTYQFKVASADWSTVDRGVAGGDTLVTLGEVKDMQVGGSNASVTITTTALYHFELNARNPSTPTIKVVDQDVFKGTPIYVRGTVTTPNWSLADATNQLAYVGNGIYSTPNINLAAGSYEFKVASADWSTVDRGVSSTNAAATVSTPKTMQVGGSNATLVIATPGNYKFELSTADPEAPIITVKPQ